ncbi:hypothetical protein [Rhodanobacter sp. OR87]|uniref:hypothetical protein n=1 Tax=Rhodanobacter sp. OR87 TaxID=1076523 RepID=UPI000487C04F|nr:hypothetical protein [Rhodanobacter sp. OR87]
MTRAPALFAAHFAVACLLTGCDRMQALSVDALAAGPARLHRLLAQCRRGEHDVAFCARVDQADLQRFMSGRTGPDEYHTLDELPAAIPPSFDGPSSGAGSNVSAEARR